MKKPMTQEERFVQMIETPVSTLIPRLAVPTIISMLVTTFYNMADTFFCQSDRNQRVRGRWASCSPPWP